MLDNIKASILTATAMLGQAVTWGMADDIAKLGLSIINVMVAVAGLIFFRERIKNAKLETKLLEKKLKKEDNETTD